MPAKGSEGSRRLGQLKRRVEQLYVRRRLQGIGYMGMTELEGLAKKVGLARRTDILGLPSLDDRLRRHFQFKNPAPIRLYPVALDVKLAESARCLFVDEKQVAWTDEPKSCIPVFNSFDANFKDFRKLPPATPQVRQLLRGQWTVVAAQ